jgi:hypothetical protein
MSKVKVMKGLVGSALLVSLTAAIAIVPMSAQAPQGAGRQGGAPSPRAAAPVDVTGLWVSLITEDWRWRMRTPLKGDYASLPLTDAARKVADAWDPAKDTAAGDACKSYGGAAIMRQPGRVRISWQDDTTLKLETEAGTQTRLFSFGAPETGTPSWQGTSQATWLPAGGNRRGGGPPRGGQLRVITTNLRPGYLRKNGVPYSGNARVTEHFTRVSEDNGDVYLIVTTLVEDPQFLNARFIVSSHFKKVPDGSAWNPTPCSAE